MCHTNKSPLNNKYAKCALHSFTSIKGRESNLEIVVKVASADGPKGLLLVLA